jgi:hypothetical protein
MRQEATADYANVADRIGFRVVFPVNRAIREIRGSISAAKNLRARKNGTFVLQIRFATGATCSRGVAVVQSAA